jgi:hypothetical protein
MQFALRYHPRRYLEQCGEQLEGFGGKVDLAIALPDPACLRVELEPAESLHGRPDFVLIRPCFHPDTFYPALEHQLRQF